MSRISTEFPCLYKSLKGVCGLFYALENAAQAMKMECQGIMGIKEVNEISAFIYP